MSHSTSFELPAVDEAARPGPLQRVSRRALLAALSRIENGEVRIREGGEERVFGRPDAARPLRARLDVHSPRLYSSVATGGSIGAAESWMRGEWSSDDLTSLVRILVRNREVRGGLDRGLARLASPGRRALHALRRNTRRGSRRNIAAHYDLGNAFFEQMLDPTLTYSCGAFERPDATMEEASIAKYERICRKLALSPADHVLEIGSGWGGFAIHAAKRHGCRVTTLTVSREQLELARRRVAEAGLDDRVSVEFCDYRDARGRYDALVSIEMIEAVGHQFFDDFFRTVSGRLAPDGRAAIQAIVIADADYETSRDRVDFIKRYIFPGGCLPAVSVIANCVARNTDMRLTGIEDLTPNYPETLRRWRARFSANLDRIRELGYPEELLRMWHFYLCYCEGGFEERRIGLVQVVLEKPRYRGRPRPVPPLSPPGEGADPRPQA